MIYAYVQLEDEKDLSSFDHDHDKVSDDPKCTVQMTKEWKETKITLRTKSVFGTGGEIVDNRYRLWVCEQTTMLAMLNTCRQFYYELLIRWVKHIRVVTNLEHLDWVCNWLTVSTPKNTYGQVSSIDIRLLSGQHNDPEYPVYDLYLTLTKWMRLELVMEEKGIHLNAVLEENVTSCLWGKAYRIAKRCRSAEMSLDEVEECIDDMGEMGEYVLRRDEGGA